jgi:hypothetical protein
VLLNGADYSYTVTGTRCPTFTFPGGTGKPNSLRGSLWSDSLSAVQRQRLCPGVYHVAVTVMDVGLGRLTGARARSCGARAEPGSTLSHDCFAAGRVGEQRADDLLVPLCDLGPDGTGCRVVVLDERREQQAARFAAEQQLALESEP